MEGAAEGVQSATDSISAKHTEEIQLLKTRYAERESELQSKIAEFEQQLEQLKASYAEQLAKTADAEEVNYIFLSARMPNSLTIF